MGLAMIREVMYPGMHHALIDPLNNESNALQGIYDMMKGLLLHNPFFQIKYGCPAVNLIEEMAPVSKQFQKALQVLIEEWQDAISKKIEQGKKSGKVNKNVHGKDVAYFISSGYGGVRNMGKLHGETAYHIYLKELKRYLETLR